MDSQGMLKEQSTNWKDCREKESKEKLNEAYLQNLTLLVKQRVNVGLMNECIDYISIDISINYDVK